MVRVSIKEIRKKKEGRSFTRAILRFSDSESESDSDWESDDDESVMSTPGQRSATKTGRRDASVASSSSFRDVINRKVQRAYARSPRKPFESYA